MARTGSILLDDKKFRKTQVRSVRIELSRILSEIKAVEQTRKKCDKDAAALAQAKIKAEAKLIALTTAPYPTAN